MDEGDYGSHLFRTNYGVSLASISTSVIKPRFVCHWHKPAQRGPGLKITKDPKTLFKRKV